MSKKKISYDFNYILLFLRLTSKISFLKNYDKTDS